MAVAGLHSVSIIGSSFPRESQSPFSRQWGSHDRPSSRASSLLLRWRELEGDHMVSHSQLSCGDRHQQRQRIDGSNVDFVSAILSENQDGDNGDSLEDGSENANEREDGNSSSSEHSSDFGEVERGRVRQIFREWMNSGVRGHASNVSPVNSYSRAQWLGENECGRVRSVREWVRMTSQQRGTCIGSREEQPTETGAESERVCDGYGVNHCEIVARRNIRKLCGRQALLDLLARAERDRQKELDELLEHRPVSDFAHRHRIQSLLKGRFLRSDRLVQDTRPSSAAASELGLLRQRHTVSGLREGFLLRLDNSIHDTCSSSVPSDTSFSNDTDDVKYEQSHTNFLPEDTDAALEQSDPSERDTNVLHTVPLDGYTAQDINCQEATAPEEQQAAVVEDEETEQLPSSNSGSVGRRDCMGGNVCGNSGGNVLNAWLQETSGNEGEERPHQLGAPEVIHDFYEPNGEERDVLESLNHADGQENNTIEGMNWIHASIQVEELQETHADNVGGYWQQADSIELTGLRDDNAEGTEDNSSERVSNNWYEETLESEGEQHNHFQELHEGWHDTGMPDVMTNLSEGPSSWQAAPAGAFDAFYFPDDDDNGYNSEIRELLSRRSVSNLLQSDFRESLDHMLQSYAERQANAPVEWETEGLSPSPSSPALVEQYVQRSGDQNQSQLDATQTAPIVLPSPPVTHSQHFWEQELHDVYSPGNNFYQRFGIEWEIINDLRIDMARLQQRMNDMQRMLEACMDMQLELQRSVRQEVSAALNRPSYTTEGDDKLQQDESKWDHVRKGICCTCCDSSIDSLLYRCGHMCTCSRCAEKLVQERGKCPMCQAPVVEMVHAYFAQH